MATPEVKVRVTGEDATKAAFESAKQNAAEFGSGIKSLLNPLDLLKGAIAGLGLAAVGEFFKSSVEAAAENEAAWGRIAQSVDNAGISFQGVQGDLKATFAELSEGSRYSETQVSSAFGNILNVTNDYAGSLKNLPLVLNIAAARHIDLETAAQLVGRVMEGNTSMLKRYGIVVKDGSDAMQQLREKFQGFAEQDATTLQGRLAQISNAWDDVKIKVGEAITNSDSAADSAGKVVTALTSFGRWIDANRGNIQGLISDLGQLGTALEKIVSFVTKYSGLSIHGKQMFSNLGASFMEGYEQGTHPGESLKLSPMEATRRMMTAGTPGAASGASGPYPVGDVNAEGDDLRVPTEQGHIDANSRKVAAAEQQAAEEKRIQALLQEADLLVKARDTIGLSLDDYKKVNALLKEMGQLEQDTNVSLKDRLAIHDKLSGIATADAARSKQMLDDEQKIAALDKQHSLSDLASTSRVATAGNYTGGMSSDNRDDLIQSFMAEGFSEAEATYYADAVMAPGNGFQAPTIGNGRINVRASAAPPPADGVSTFSSRMKGGEQETTDALGLSHIDTSLGDLAEKLGTFRTTALAGFFDDWQQGIQDVVSGHESLGQAIVASARKAIGGAMAAEGQATLLKAAAAAAEGLFNPAKLVQAAELFGVGTAELALAATLSGGGGGGSSGSSGGGGGSATGNLTSSQGTARGKASIVIKGNGINFNNPDELNALLAAIQSLDGTRDLEFLRE